MSGPLRHFSSWLGAYVDYTQHSESPDSLHFWTGVSVIAGALRRRVWVDERYFQWSPNFYIIFVAPPGIASKSTCVNIGMRLLSEVEGIHFGPQSLTWQGLTVALEEAKDTVAVNGGESFLPMSCLTIPVSELGTFLKPKETDLIDLLVDLWDGQIRTWRHRIKTGDKPETTIVNPWINLIGCTTPAWLRSNFPSYMIEGGLTSRVIFVFAEQKRKLVAYPSEVIDAGIHEAKTRLLAEDLRIISELMGEYKRTPAANAWGKAWYENHWSSRPAHLLSERFGGYYARKQGHIHKLAIVLAASQRNELLITERDLATADRLVTSLELDLKKVFDSIGMVDSARHSTDVLQHIRVHKFISLKELYTLMLSLMEREDIERSLTALVQTGKVKQDIVNGELGYAVTDAGLDKHLHPANGIPGLS